MKYVYNSRPLNGIVKPFLFFDSSIGNRITCAPRSMCLCSSFLLLRSSCR